MTISTNSVDRVQEQKIYFNGSKCLIVHISSMNGKRWINDDTRLIKNT